MAAHWSLGSSSRASRSRISPNLFMATRPVGNRSSIQSCRACVGSSFSASRFVLAHLIQSHPAVPSSCSHPAYLKLFCTIWRETILS